MFQTQEVTNELIKGNLIYSKEERYQMYKKSTRNTPKELQRRIQKIYEIKIRQWSDATQSSHPLIKWSKQKLFDIMIWAFNTVKHLFVFL